ncbi:substrate-binding periplasmic protein [Spartinivicinus poritis]|uniref:Transporter substrate-binding domain-containing protein n=1 Tax=Spartinivicinus poritis TaxID=2994640 RepID=A0ABT5UE80_9GAMM|nr:transporter substrate-binding domain-containing protein [Spartinivicinus sp. A2-2]MDE1464676.1 transporter substrate-binding domain-containing protein [Spartinivicinus sp. A2-2]
MSSTTPQLFYQATKLFTICHILPIIFCHNLYANETVKICDDDGEWPPFIYYQRVNGKPDKSKLTGASVELIDAAFKLTSFTYSLQLLPWQRCLDEVNHFGKRGNFEALTNASFSMERAKKYYATTSIYELHSGVFYSKEKFPDGPVINKPSDLNNFKLCGVLGYNYEYLYTKYGLNKNKTIDTGANNIFSVLTMIANNRCDIFENSLEPIYGAVLVGKYTLPSNIASAPLANVDKIYYHIHIAKTSPRAYKILTELNQAILILQHQGVSKKIFDKYLKSLRR